MPVSYAYQWRRGTTAIPGATTNTYLLVAADVANTMNCQVTATNAAGSVTINSNDTTAVLPLAPVNTIAPVLSGTAQQGQTLSVTTGTWNNVPTSYTYQWRRGTTSIGGATSSTYLLVVADIGSAMNCQVTAVNAGGSTMQQSNSSATVVVANWLPSDDASLLWWLDAQDLTTITKDGSNLVSAWNNKKVTGFGNVTASGADRPTWISGTPPYIETLGKRMIGSFSYTGTTTMLLGVGTLVNAGAAGGSYVSFASTGVASSGAGGTNWWKRDTTIEAVNSNYGGSNYGSLVVVYTVPFVFAATRITTRGDNYLNGGTAVGANLTVTTDFDFCAVGVNITSAGVVGGGPVHGRIGEILMFDSINTTLRQKAEGYLAHRWGITLAAGHPYLSAPP